jgi:hypothetical protein
VAYQWHQRKNGISEDGMTAGGGDDIVTGVAIVMKMVS